MKINEINSQKYVSEISKNIVKKEPLAKQHISNGKDEIQLSLKGKQLSQSKRLLKIAKAKLKDIPDVRFDKIESAVKNIRNGKHSSSEVVGKIADSLLQKPEFQEIIQQKGQKNIIPTEKVQEIKAKMDSDFYSKPEIVDKIARNILKDFSSGK